MIFFREKTLYANANCIDEEKEQIHFSLSGEAPPIHGKN